MPCFSVKEKENIKMLDVYSFLLLLFFMCICLYILLRYFLYKHHHFPRRTNFNIVLCFVFRNSYFRMFFILWQILWRSALWALNKLQTRILRYILVHFGVNIWSFRNHLTNFLNCLLISWKMRLIMLSKVEKN